MIRVRVPRSLKDRVAAIAESSATGADVSELTRRALVEFVERAEAEQQRANKKAAK